jgi:hypothetical protein
MENATRRSLATMDQSDIRGLVTALHRSVAELPLSNDGDHRCGCPHKTFEDSPDRVCASRFPSGVVGIGSIALLSADEVFDQVAPGTWRARSHIKPHNSRAMATQVLF